MLLRVPTVAPSSTSGDRTLRTDCGAQSSFVIAALAAFIVAFLVAIVMTPVAASVARSWGVVSSQRPDRWGARPTPLLGGVAIALAIVVASVVPGVGLPTIAWVVLLAMLAALMLGLIDDVRGLRPTSKLVGQVVIGSGLALAGIRPEALAQFPALAFLATLLWVVVLMNAVNLVDNMDGLAAGLTAIAAAVLVFLAPPETPWVATVAAATSGASLGFLVHNFPPARVYMGDAGSLTLGCVLAALALLMTNQAASNLGLAILAPLLALGLPLFDAVLVTLVRRLERRPVSQGGRDHMSHRLAALGLSDRETVLVLYGVAVAMAGLGLVANAIGLAFVPLLALVLIALVLFGIFLVEQPSPGAHGRRGVLGSGHRLVRYGAEIGLDVALASLALLSAYLVRFESFAVDVWMPLFVAALPIVIPIQLAAFVLLGVYRVLWRFAGLIDLLVIARASAAGTLVAAVVVLYFQQSTGQSRGAFLIDALLLAVFVAGSRLFLATLRQWFALQGRIAERRVLIVGANDVGEIALRLLLRSTDPAYRLVGFIDDDPGKHRRRIAGVPVLGDINALEAAVEQERVDLVVLAVDAQHAGAARARAHCRAVGIEIREFARL